MRLKKIIVSDLCKVSEFLETIWTGEWNISVRALATTTGIKITPSITSGHSEMSTTGNEESHIASSGPSLSLDIATLLLSYFLL
jgi:hypothetical protein